MDTDRGVGRLEEKQVRKDWEDASNQCAVAAVSVRTLWFLLEMTERLWDHPGCS